MTFAHGISTFGAIFALLVSGCGSGGSSRAGAETSGSTGSTSGATAGAGGSVSVSASSPGLASESGASGGSVSEAAISMSASSSGSSSSSVVPAPVVTDCDADGGLGPVGVWQPIWVPQSFLSDQKLETSSVAVDPHDQAVYVAAGSYTNGGDSGTGIYRSTDCGATFELASTGTGATNVASGDPWVLRANPASPGTLYLVLGYGDPGGFYESTDRGVDWSLLATSPWQPAGSSLTPQALAVSPASSGTMALSFHDDCSAPYGALCFGVTTDGGATWTAIDGPSLTPAGWQEAASLSLLGPSTFLYLGASSGSVSYSNDNGATWSTPTFQSATGAAVMPSIGESYGGSTYFGPDGTLYVGTATGIFASRGATLGTQWAELASSPPADCLIDDGTFLYASDTWTGNGQYGNGDGQVFWRAPLSDLTAWTQMVAEDSPRGSYEFAYDSIHHIVYSANMIGGLWRLVTQ